MGNIDSDSAIAGAVLALVLVLVGAIIGGLAMFYWFGRQEPDGGTAWDEWSPLPDSSEPLYVPEDWSEVGEES